MENTIISYGLAIALTIFSLLMKNYRMHWQKVENPDAYLCAEIYINFCSSDNLLHEHHLSLSIPLERLSGPNTTKHNNLNQHDNRLHGKCELEMNTNKLYDFIATV